jgi:two-component system, LytTR family, response regulator
MIRTLLVDDEPLALLELESMLKHHADIDIIGFAHSGGEALTKIRDLQPELLFLDITMPDKSGFDILQDAEYAPVVVFVTAYDTYAVKAFEVNALDYLLKPVNAQRLSETIQKIVKRIQTPRDVGTSTEQLSIDKRIFIKNGDRCYFVPLSDIYLIESVGNYARLYYHDNNPLMHKSLNYLEEKLPTTHFFRANRQHIINVHFIKKINSFFNNTLQVEMLNGYTIEISQRQSVIFKELMGI